MHPKNAYSGMLVPCWLKEVKVGFIALAIGRQVSLPPTFCMGEENVFPGPRGAPLCILCLVIYMSRAGIHSPNDREVLGLRGGGLLFTLEGDMAAQTQFTKTLRLAR